MSEKQGTTTPAEATPTRPRRTRRGWLIAGSVVGVLMLAAGTTAYVYAHGGGGWHSWRGHLSDEEIADRIELRVKYALQGVEATEEQRAKVTAILQAAAIDVHALASGHRGAHQQLHDILSAETIDRARLESVRAETLGLADQASKRIVQGIADAAEVLTPQQRAELSEQLEQRRAHWHDSDD